MKEYDFAVELVRQAGVRVKKSLEGEIVVSHKDGPRDPVTNIDIEISEFLTAEIKKQFPDHSVYSEEDTGVEKAQMRGSEWILDPIDGTGNFYHRIPHFAICATLLRDGVPTVGAIYNPMTDELFSFEAGRGAFLNAQPIRVSRVTEPSDAQGFLIVGHKPELWDWGAAVHPSLLHSLNKLKGLGSSNLDLAFLAAGRADVVVYGTFSMPDGAPGVGIVRAAGGEVYEVKSGNPIAVCTERQTIVAVSNKELYEKVKPLLHRELLPS